MRCYATSVSRSISPLIAVAENRCRSSDSDAFMSAGLQFLEKQPNKLFDAICFCVYEYMTYLYVYDVRIVFTLALR